MEALLAQANTSCPTGKRNRAILEVMVHGGLRIAEVAALHPRDIVFNREGRDLAGADLAVLGKGRKRRTVPVSRGVAQWLDLWDRERPRNGHFFCTIQGNPVSTSYIRQMVYRYAERADIQEELESNREDGKRKLKVHPHSLRGTYASALHRDDDYTIAEIRDLLGHENIATTNEYLRVDPAALREKIQGKQKKQEIAALQEQVAELNERLAVLAAE